MDESIVSEIGILTAERDYHVTHVQSLNTRVGFVALSFAGLLLMNAMNARSKLQEATAEYLKEFADANGKALREALEPDRDDRSSRAQMKRSFIAVKARKIKFQLTEQVRLVAFEARLPEPHWSVYAAVLIAGIGAAFILSGLTRHSRIHMIKARELQGRIDSIYTANSEGAPNNLFDKEPDCATSIRHHDGRIFLGIWFVWAAAQIVAYLIMYEERFAAVLTGCAIVPTAIVGIFRLAVAYRHSETVESK